MIDNSRIKVSVILPVYNVEGYIERCIESLQAQKLDGLEFIFVDDCSTDGSMKPVEAWAAKDERVRIIRNDENIGTGPSRNRGIEVAQGEYLSFIDPDDYISRDFYELLYTAATRDGRHDIAKGVRKKVDEKGELIQEEIISINKRIRLCLRASRPLYTAFTYEHQTALYSRMLFSDSGVRYGTSCNSQDTTFLLRCCYQTKDIVMEASALYYYMQRTESAVHSTSMRRINGELDALSEKAAFFKERDIDYYAQSYLGNKFRAINSIVYLWKLNTPPLIEAMDEYTRKLKEIVEKSPALHFLQKESLEYRALVEENVLLPSGGCLPEDKKLKGVLRWVSFVYKNHITDISYLVKCAKVTIIAFLQLGKIKGNRLHKKILRSS